VKEGNLQNERLRGFSQDLNERLKALGIENNRDVLEEAQLKPNHLLNDYFDKHGAQHQQDGKGLNQALGVADDNADPIMDLPKYKFEQLQQPGRRKEPIESGDANEEVADLLMDALLEGAVIDDSGEMDLRGEDTDTLDNNRYSGGLDIDHFDIVPADIDEISDVDSIMDSVSKKFGKVISRDENIDSFELKPYVSMTIAIGKKEMIPIIFKMFTDEYPEVVRNFEMICDGAINSKDYLLSYDYSVMKLSKDKRLIKSSRIKGEGVHHFYENEQLPHDDILSNNTLSLDGPGKLAMVRSDEGSDGSQFFLTLDDLTDYDEQYMIIGETLHMLDADSIEIIQNTKYQMWIGGCEAIDE